MVNLTYRGVKYSADEPLTESAQTATTVQGEDPKPNFARTGYLPAPQPVHRLTYRGANYQQPLPVLSEAQPDHHLTYRGVHYQQPLPVLREVQQAQRNPEPVARAVPTSLVASMGQSAKARFVEPSQRRSVLEYLQTRLKAAKAEGDQVLVGLLQQEIQLLF